MQAGQMPVGELQQMVQREALGKLAELVAFGGTDQPVQPLPDIGLHGLVADLLKQRLLVFAVLRVNIEQGALGADLLAQATALRFQRRQFCGDFFGCQWRERLCLQLRVFVACNWQTYTRDFLKHIQTQDAPLRELVKIAQATPACLVCFEADYSTCHRTYVARAARQLGGPTVTHLTAKTALPDLGYQQAA